MTDPGAYTPSAMFHVPDSTQCPKFLFRISSKSVMPSHSHAKNSVCQLFPFLSSTNDTVDSSDQGLENKPVKTASRYSSIFVTNRDNGSKAGKGIESPVEANSSRTDIFNTAFGPLRRFVDVPDSTQIRCQSFLLKNDKARRSKNKKPLLQQQLLHQQQQLQQHLIPTGTNAASNSGESQQPVGFFWDIENLGIPRYCSSGSVVSGIRKRILIAGRQEKLFVTACDVFVFDRVKDKMKDLQMLQIQIRQVFHLRKNDADMVLKNMMLDFADKYGPGSCIVLLTSDKDFAVEMKHVKKRVGCHVILIHGADAPDLLLRSCSEAIPFEDITRLCNEDVAAGSSEQSSATRQLQSSPTRNPQEDQGQNISPVPGPSANPASSDSATRDISRPITKSEERKRKRSSSCSDAKRPKQQRKPRNNKKKKH